MASFQAKIGWERPKKGEKKNHSDGFLPDREQKISKKQQKNSKIQKTPSHLLFKQKQDGKGREREKIKKTIPMGSYPTGNQKFQKNSKKIQKFRKHHHTFISSKNRMGKAEQERKKKKKNHFDGFLPDREQQIPKKQQKNSKIQKTPSYLLFK